MQPALAWVDKSLEKPMNLEQHWCNPVSLLQHVWKLGQSWCNCLQVRILHINRAHGFLYWHGVMLTCGPWVPCMSSSAQPNPIQSNPVFQILWLEGETSSTKLFCRWARSTDSHGSAPWPLSFCVTVLLHHDPWDGYLCPAWSWRESQAGEVSSNSVQFHWVAHTLFSTCYLPQDHHPSVSRYPQYCHFFVPSLSHNPA